MSIKKTLALVAALTLISTAFVGCGKDDDSSKSSTGSSSSKADSSDTSSEGGDTAELSLPTDGDTLTVMSWNDEFPKMVANHYKIGRAHV